MNVEPVGWVHSPRTQPEEDGWDGVTATIALDASTFDATVLLGLDAFSHVEVVYVFDRVDPNAAMSPAGRPRENPEWPEVGIFAQRGTSRPNRLGVTVCRLVEVDGLTLTLSGLDAIDGTPVLDIKPWVTQLAARGPTRQPSWSDEIMSRYW